MAEINLKKLFVLVPKGTIGDKTSVESIITASSSTDKIYFVADVNQIIARGVAYGIDPTTTGKITDLISLIGNDGKLADEGINAKTVVDRLAALEAISKPSTESYINVTGATLNGDGTIASPVISTNVIKMSEIKENTAEEGEPSNAVTGEGKLVDAKDIKDYIDAASAKSTTVVEGEGKADGITVTTETAKDGHITYKIKNDLQIKYVAANGTDVEDHSYKPAHIDLYDAADDKVISSIAVSDIIGNGLLSNSAYDESTGILTLTFANADGATTTHLVDLKAMLDINDMSIASNSTDYLEVTLDNSQTDEDGNPVYTEGNTQAVFGVKIKKMSEVEDNTAEEGQPSNAVTGLADALDVKKYVDSKTSDLAVTAEGDNYVSASVDADKDNKHVIVETNVVDVNASAGTRGTWTVSDTGDAVLTGETAPTIKGEADSLMDGAQAIEAVKTYVDAKVAAETAERAAKIEAAVKSLDVNETEVSEDGEGKITFKYSETDGKVSVSDLSVTYSEKTGTDKDAKLSEGIVSATTLNAALSDLWETYSAESVSEPESPEEETNEDGN